MQRRTFLRTLWIVPACVVAGAAAVLVPNRVSVHVPGRRQLVWLAHRVYFFGDAYQCNVCGRSFRKFRQDATTNFDPLCPLCGSWSRHRTFLLYFKQRTDLFDGKPKRMLHVAPEVFMTPIFRAERNIDYLSGDLEPGNPAIGEAMVKLDVTDIQYPDNSFDVIFCSHVLEHVPDDKRGMRELARVLKPGGWALIAVPIVPSRARTFEDPTVTTPAERLRVFGQSDHVRIYGSDFPDRLRESGFDVTVDAFASGLSEEIVRRHGLSRENIFLCRKHPTSLA